MKDEDMLIEAEENAGDKYRRITIPSFDGRKTYIKEIYPKAGRSIDDSIIYKVEKSKTPAPFFSYGGTMENLIKTLGLAPEYGYCTWDEAIPHIKNILKNNSDYVVREINTKNGILLSIHEKRSLN